jgi:hypothetical protein
MAGVKRGIQPNGDWYVYAGDRNSERVEFLSAGAPWNLNGAVIEAQAREKDTTSGETSF